MRIDGLPSNSYPIKRKPRKGSVRAEESIEDVEGEVEAMTEARPRSSGSNVMTLPARHYSSTMSRSTATALASYMSTASFVDWDLEVLGLDVHI